MRPIVTALLLVALLLLLAVRIHLTLRSRRLRALVRREEIGRTQGPVTALEAAAFARPFVQKLDGNQRLVGISALGGVSSDGRSATWELAFDLPTLRGSAVAAFTPAGDTGDDLVVTLHGSSRQHHAKTPSLPPQPVDSPAAIAELEAQGADFTAGDSHANLACGCFADRPGVWESADHDRKRTTPLEQGTDGFSAPLSEVAKG